MELKAIIGIALVVFIVGGFIFLQMDTIRDSIETRANDVLKRDKNRESR